MMRPPNPNKSSEHFEFVTISESGDFPLGDAA
jgi:hypothetical protein